MIFGGLPTVVTMIVSTLSLSLVGVSEDSSRVRRRTRLLVLMPYRLSRSPCFSCALQHRYPSLDVFDLDSLDRPIEYALGSREFDGRGRIWIGHQF